MVRQRTYKSKEVICLPKVTLSVLYRLMEKFQEEKTKEIKERIQNEMARDEAEQEKSNQAMHEEKENARKTVH